MRSSEQLYHKHKLILCTFGFAFVFNGLFINFVYQSTTDDQKEPQQKSPCIFAAMAHDEEKYFVFVYGTLKRGQPNHYFFTEAFSPGKATLLGAGETINKYPLVVATDNNLPFLLKAEGEGENVEGEIYEIDSRKLAWLDHFESHPDFYRRELTDIKVKDGTISNKGQVITADGVCQCWVYFLSKLESKMLSQKMFKSYSSWSREHGPYNTSEEMTTVDDL